MAPALLFDPKADAELRSKAAEGIRQVRTVQYDNTDLDILLTEGQQLQSSILNACAAFILDAAEKDSQIAHWTVFSSWLAPLSQGHYKTTTGIGTIMDHVQAAVRDVFPSAK
jgi:hypothetical protein